MAADIPEKQHVGTGRGEGRSHVRGKAPLVQTNVGGKCIPKHDCLARPGSGSVGNLAVGRKTPYSLSKASSNSYICLC